MTPASRLRQPTAAPAFFATLALLAGLVFSTIAQAQSDTPVEAGPVVDAGPKKVDRPLWELGLGVAGLRLPDYRGSDQSRSYLLPLPYIVYRGTFLRADRDGARALLFNSDRVKVDVSVAGSTPTRNNNTAREGMPELKGTAEIGPNLNITLAGSRKDDWQLDLRLPVRAAFTVERSPSYIGNTFSPKLNLDITRIGGGWNLGLQTGPLFADRKYHEHFYGVDPVYATADRPAYQAHGGYAGWQALAATSQRFGNMWVGGFLRYDSLSGAAFEDSPLVRKTSAVTLGFGISWVLWTSTEMVPSSD